MASWPEAVAWISSTGTKLENCLRWVAVGGPRLRFLEKGVQGGSRRERQLSLCFMQLSE